MDQSKRRNPVAWSAGIGVGRGSSTSGAYFPRSFQLRRARYGPSGMKSLRSWSRAPSLPCQTTSPSATAPAAVRGSEVSSGSGSPQTDTPVTCPAPSGQLLTEPGVGHLVRQHGAKPAETRVVRLGGVEGRIDVAAGRCVVAVHVPLRIDVGQVCEEQLHAPWQAAESRSAGFSLLVPASPRHGAARIRRRASTSLRCRAWKWQLKKGPPWPREKGPPNSPQHITFLGSPG